MLSNKIVSLLSTFFLAFVLIGCDGKISSNPDFLIGDEVDNMSSLTPPESAKTQNIAIYDKTVKRIHQFELQKMEHLNAYPVQHPDQEHYVLSDFNGNYIVDLTKKGFSLIRKDGTTLHNPISMQGNPRSTAFRPALGLLIIYDDLMSVGIMKLSPEGVIQKSRLSGAKLDGASFAAGDINEDGNLVVALSTDAIAVIDVEQTLAQKTDWIFTQFPSTVSGISWVAPVPGHPEQIFVRGTTEVALIDINTQTILQKMSLSGSVEKISKNRDPHLIVKSYSTSTLIYVSNSAIKTETLYRSGDNVLTSYLDLKNDKWYVVEYANSIKSIFNNPNEVDEERTFKSYRLSDMLALSTKSLPGKAKIQLADNFIFALYPSDLGYAVRYELDSELALPLEFFNVKYINP